MYSRRSITKRAADTSMGTVWPCLSTKGMGRWVTEPLSCISLRNCRAASVSPHRPSSCAVRPTASFTLQPMLRAKVSLTIAKRPVPISVNVIRSGLVATRWASIDSDRRTACSAARRSVSSTKMASMAAPASVSTSTVVARTETTRPCTSSRKSATGNAVPGALFCSASSRRRSRSRESPLW